MKNLLVIILLSACSNSSKLDPKHHLASEFAAMVPEKITGKCTEWTADSVLCKMSETSILWCQATPGTKPHCEVAVDWSPKVPEPPKIEAPATPEESKEETKTKKKK
jgi:hypothetical protein